MGGENSRAGQRSFFMTAGMKRRFEMKTTFYAALILVGASTLTAFAQHAAPNGSQAMPGMTMSAPDTETSPSTKAFKAADEKMMHAMMVPMTGEADRDFVAGMLPHHQGAVDMAKVELQYGKDPEMRRLAADIVEAQEKEIALMRAWQAKHPVGH
jgi:uncharacterized protein (DUF305 family)